METHDFPGSRSTELTDEEFAALMEGDPWANERASKSQKLGQLVDVVHKALLLKRKKKLPRKKKPFLSSGLKSLGKHLNWKTRASKTSARRLSPLSGLALCVHQAMQQQAMAVDDVEETKTALDEYFQFRRKHTMAPQ